MGEENFHEGGAGFFSIFLKSKENEYEKVSSTENKEQHYSLNRNYLFIENEQKLLRIWGVHLLLMPRSLR